MPSTFDQRQAERRRRYVETELEDRLRSDTYARRQHRLQQFFAPSRNAPADGLSARRSLLLAVVLFVLAAVVGFAIVMAW